MGFIGGGKSRPPSESKRQPSGLRLEASIWKNGLASPIWNFPGKNTGMGKPFPSPWDLPNPGIEPGSPTLQADSLLSEPPGFNIK